MFIIQGFAQPSCPNSSDIEYSTHEDRDINGLWLSEIKRRRERDFGHDADSSSATDVLMEEEFEEDYEDVLECGSLCTESETNSEITNLDGMLCDSESDIGDQKKTQVDAHDDVIEGKLIVND